MNLLDELIHNTTEKFLAALEQLLALSDSRKVIEQLFWDGLIDEDENEALNIIWRAAEKTIRSEAKCLE